MRRLLLSIVGLCSLGVVGCHHVCSHGVCDCTAIYDNPCCTRSPWVQYGPAPVEVIGAPVVGAPVVGAPVAPAEVAPMPAPAKKL